MVPEYADHLQLHCKAWISNGGFLTPVFITASNKLWGKKVWVWVFKNAVTDYDIDYLPTNMIIHYIESRGVSLASSAVFNASLACSSAQSLC